MRGNNKPDRTRTINEINVPITREQPTATLIIRPNSSSSSKTIEDHVSSLSLSRSSLAEEKCSIVGGGRYEGGSYSAGAQRPYYDNANRGRGTSNYRGEKTLFFRCFA